MSEDTSGSNAERNPGPPPAKKIRGQEPDVIVAVGQGDKMQEFPCYRVALCFASDYLDAMLSSSMKEGESSRIEFPDKDPEEWELVYKFIDPSTLRDAEVTLDNVEVLLPWFHEFQMEGLLSECQDVILEDLQEDCDEEWYWDDWKEESRNEALNKIVHYANLVETYSLEGVVQKTHIAIAHAFVCGSDVWTYDLVKQVAPILQARHKDECSCGCDMYVLVITDMVSQFLAKNTEEIEQEIEAIDPSGKNFCQLLYLYTQREYLRRKPSQLDKATES